MRRLVGFGLIICLGLVLAACGAASEATATPSQEFERILLENFDNNNNNWQTFDEKGKGKVDFSENQYRIKVAKSNTFIYAYPIEQKITSLGDVSLLVEAKTIAGDTNNLYGVICRYKDKLNFYFFVVSSDGFFGIGKVINGKYQLINRSDYPPSEAVLTKTKTNRIRADCLGSTLSLYVNDQWVDSQVDTDLTQGRVGLIAGALGSETTILFDTFDVREPKP